MEVDVGSPSPSGASVSVAMPAAYAGGGATTSQHHSRADGSQKKRRRNVTSFLEDDSAEASGSFQLIRNHSDDDETPAKRRNMATPSWIRREEHAFRSLGDANVANTYDSTVEDYEYEATTSDNGVDSPMHSLSLVSPSPSMSAIFADLYTQTTADDVLDDEQDADMDEITGEASSVIAASEDVSSTSMLPRQLRPRSVQLSNAPARPSPLVHGRGLSEEPSTSSSNDSSPRPASMEVSSNGSPHPLRRSVTSESFAVNDLRPSLGTTTTPVRTFSHDDLINTPVRRMSRTERAARTPSPRPQLRPDDQPGGAQSGEERGGGGGVTRALHHSPGLHQPSNFPGGKQMLRYTMGYRNDCDLCRNKVAGHYGHVIHRSSSMNQ